MKITIKNEITGLMNTIEFKLFEELSNQNDYMSYLIGAMNINMDFILHIRARNQQHFAQEELKTYLFENGYTDEMLSTNNENTMKKIAERKYFEMMSNLCVTACVIHYKKTLKPDRTRRSKFADEYEKTFLGSLNEKKT